MSFGSMYTPDERKVTIDGSASTVVRVDRVLDVSEFEALAKSFMSAMSYAYVSGAAADEITLAENSSHWQRIRLKPWVLVDVSRIDPSVELFGKRLSFPLLLAPAAYHRLYYRDGELAVARAAEKAGSRTRHQFLCDRGDREHYCRMLCAGSGSRRPSAGQFQWN